MRVFRNAANIRTKERARHRRPSFVLVLYHLSAVSSIFGGVWAFLTVTKSQAASVFPVYWLCGLLALTWVLLPIWHYLSSRKSRFADATEYEHCAFHWLRDAWYSLGQGDSNDTISGYVHEAVLSLSKCFALITGVPCRVCIKSLFCVDHQGAEHEERPDRRLKVRTLCRSEGCQSNIDEGDDWVSDNTDFKVLTRNPSLQYFFSNDLRKYPNYSNSHWDSEVLQGRPVDYISTIVWPIRKTRSEAPDSVGFLCVDSLVAGAFDEYSDVPFGAAFADVLYIVLKAWESRKEKIEKQKEVAYDKGC